MKNRLALLLSHIYLLSSPVHLLSYCTDVTFVFDSIKFKAEAQLKLVAHEELSIHSLLA
jgi:hypothetical protein